jgi:chromosome segregation ATPase
LTETTELCGGEDFYGVKDYEQENIVSDLVQRYINSMNMPTDINQEFRRKFEQLYFENNKLGQSLRSRVNEVAQLRKQFEELQATKNQLEAKLVHADKKVEEFERKIRQQQPQQQWRIQRTPSVQGKIQVFGYLPLQQQQQPCEYESLPTMTSYAEESLIPVQVEEITVAGQQQQQPTLKGVEQLLNQLENKLTTLRLCTPQQQREQQQQQIQIQLVQEPLQQQQQQQGCVGSTTATTVYEVAAKKQEFKICPVCGIAIEKELSQPEFELHVNSHFPYTD